MFHHLWLGKWSKVTGKENSKMHIQFLEHRDLISSSKFRVRKFSQKLEEWEEMVTAKENMVSFCKWRDMSQSSMVGTSGFALWYLQNRNRWYLQYITPARTSTSSVYPHISHSILGRYFDYCWTNNSNRKDLHTEPTRNDQSIKDIEKMDMNTVNRTL